jgi:membrane-bound lytic murein transglycosylase MltF
MEFWSMTRRPVFKLSLPSPISVFAFLLITWAGTLGSAAAQADSTALPDATLTPAEEAAVDKMALPLPKQQQGDFDAMRKRRLVRILVTNSKTLYFLDRGRELGIDKEYANAFEQALNAKYKTKSLKIRVALIPVARDKLLSMLRDGYGDIAAAGMTVTPERQAEVDFAAPLASGVKEIVVTGPSAPQLTSLDDLSGKAVLVRRSSSYYTHLTALNADLEKRQKPPIILTLAAEDIEDEDLLEMVNAGLLPFVVVDRYKAKFWEQIYKKIKPREDLIVNQGGDIAWAIRKDSPLLKAEIDAFMKTHRVGTSFGNTIVRRYLKNTKQITNASSAAQMARFEKLAGIFQTYAKQYSFNELMLMAQGYQESQLDQARRSPRGAVGVMQMLPSTAADPSVGVKGIDASAEKNIMAGTKYMALLRDKYVNDPAISDKDKVLMTFAAYNAGPGNLNKFRRLAEKSGLDKNVWFDNVEVAASRIVGRETVQYVSNIYKYYVAYELVRRREAMRADQKSAINAEPIGDGAGDANDVSVDATAKAGSSTASP